MTSHVEDPGDIVAIQAAYSTGALNPVALVERLLERVARVDPVVRAWCDLDEADVLTQAHARSEELARGPARSALHGIPVSIKDVIDVRGRRTRAGSLTRYAIEMAAADADIVGALRAAGAIIMGKVHTTEFAFFDGAPPTRNPWDLARTPGGSSGGPAASVAAGMVPASVGTQTAGSIVRPAAYCGIAAFKPSTQDLSTQGIVPLAPAFDTPGWFGYRFSDVSATATALQPQRFMARERMPQPLRIAVLDDGLLSRSDDAVADSIQRSIRLLIQDGHDVQVVSTPIVLDDVLVQHRCVLEFELAKLHAGLLDAPSGQVTPRLLQAIREGRARSVVAYELARHGIAEAQRLFWAALESFDMVLAPAAPSIAPAGTGTGDPSFIVPFTALGGPIATLPIALSAEGLPLGVMLIAAPGSDALLISHASRLAGTIELPRSASSEGLLR